VLLSGLDQSADSQSSPSGLNSTETYYRTFELPNEAHPSVQTIVGVMVSLGRSRFLMILLVPTLAAAITISLIGPDIFVDPRCGWMRQTISDLEISIGVYQRQA